MKKTIITVIGKDTVGIIAKVCTYLAENNVNILYISQTIEQDYFKEFEVLSKELKEVGEQIGVKIKMQHEDIFNCMHRI